MSADDYWHMSVDRLRTTVNVTEVHEITLETSCFTAPCCFHCSEILVSAVSSALERNSECVEFFLQPTGPNSEDHSTFGEPVKSSDGLRGDQRVPLRHNHDAGTEANLLGGGSDIRQPNQWIGNIKVFSATWHSPVFCVGVLGGVTRWHHYVFNGPN